MKALPLVVVTTLLALAACTSLQSMAGDVKTFAADAKSIMEVVKALLAQLQQVLAFLLEVYKGLQQGAEAAGLSTEAVVAIAGGAALSGGGITKFLGGRKA